jgi:outer membrane protein assembly factor BamD
VAIVLLTAVLTIAGCAGDNERDMKSGADQIFERARASMDNRNYRNAISYYEALEARFPFSNQAKQAQLDLIYCYYKNGEKESAMDAAQQFERENPTHPRVDYALYMRGLINFPNQHGFFHKLLRVDLARRPQAGARESFSAFSQLLQRYPNSIYAADARQRMIFLRDRLAEHENYVARYYLRRGAYLAALNRAKSAMTSYDGAPAIPESMRIMVEAYTELGMTDLAESTRAVMSESFPQTTIAEAAAADKPWYKFW